jgi:hypothetical protein
MVWPMKTGSGPRLNSSHEDKSSFAYFIANDLALHSSKPPAVYLRGLVASS